MLPYNNYLYEHYCHTNPEKRVKIREIYEDLVIHPPLPFYTRETTNN